MEKNIFLRSGINEKSDVQRMVPLAFLFFHLYEVNENVKIRCSVDVKYIEWSLITGKHTELN